MWTYSIGEDYTSGSQIFSVVVDSSNQFSADDQEYSVSFISMGWTGYGKFGRKFREAEYAMPADLTELLVTQIGTFFDDGSVEDSAQITLDLSGLGLNGVAVDLRKLSVHQRPDRDRDLNDGVDSTSFGSVLTTIIGTEQDDYIIGSYHAETIRGGGGNDYIAGGGGDDMLFGDDGDDVISTGSGSDVIDGGSGSDTLWFRYVWGSENPAGSLLAAIADAGDSTAEYFEDAQAFAELTSTYDIDPASIGIWVRMDADGDGPGAEGFAFTTFELFTETGHEDEGLQKNIFTDIENITIENYNSRSGGDEILLNSALVEGDDGENEIITGRGDDWIFGGGGTDRLFGHTGDDHIYGGDGNDYIYGGYGDDSLYGGDGNDRIFGGVGNDRLEAGAGDDRLEGWNGADTLSGGSGQDELLGGRGSDTLYGGSGKDSLYGHAGADTLYGGANNDSLYGGQGDDVLYGGDGGDVLDGGGGTDTVSYADSTDGVIVNLSTGDASGGFAVGDSFIDIENLIGTKNGDQLYGNDGDNVLSAGDGRDHLYGGAGDDTLHGGADQDILKGDAGTNMLFGDGGDDGFLVSEGLDIIDGGAGYDRYDATFSDAGVTINLGDVDDEGFAEASGGLAEGDLLKSIERLIGSHHDDVLTGDDDVNQLEGNMGNDILTGGGGSDVIYGEEGDDIIDGGSGNDVLSGGEGDDIFILNLIDGDTDVIGDFSRGNNKIRIISDDTGSSLADYDIEVRTDTNSFGTVSTYLYLDTNDNGSYDKMILSLTGFTGWDDSLHLDTSVQSDFV